MATPSIYEQMAGVGQVDEALEKCENDIASFQLANSNKEYADALHAKASILKFYKSDYQKALDCLELEIQLRLSHGLANVDAAYLKAAILHSYLGQSKYVISFVELALKTTTDRNIRAIALNVKGDALYTNAPDNALLYFKEAEKLFISTEDTYNLSHVLLSIARLEGYKGNTHLALSMCEQELNKGLKLENPGILGTAYLRLAEVHVYTNNVAASRLFAEKAHAIGLAQNWDVLQWEAEKMMV